MRALVVVGCLLIASPAFGQTTTDCSRDYFGNIRCTTNTSPTINWGLLNPRPAPDAGQSFMQGYEDARARRQETERQRRVDEQAATERVNSLAAQILREKTGQMIVAGDCAGAEALAIASGDFALGLQIKDYCAGE